MRTVRLGDVVDSVGGGTPPKSHAEFYGGAIPWVTPKDMKAFDIADTRIRITDAGLAHSAARLVPAGSVLVVVRSGVLKHTLPVAVATRSVSMNQDMRALLPSPDIDSRYLAHLVRANASVVLNWVRATTADNFPVGRLLDLVVPVPNPAEQRRIARLLDSAESLLHSRRRAITTAAELPAAFYSEMFSTADSALALADVADVASGITKGRRVNGHTTASVPYLAVSNVQDGRLDLARVKRIDATVTEIARYRLQDGDLLLTEGGDPDKLGRGALWTSELDPCIHQNHIFRVRIRDRDVVEPQFLQAQVAAGPARRYFLRAAKQTTGIASINKTQLAALPIHLPVPAKQRAFVQRIDATATAVEAQRRHLARLERLFASLQHRAFTGAL